MIGCGLDNVSITRFVANMQTVDDVVNSPDLTVVTPGGNTQTTLAGYNAEFEAAIANLGWVVIDSFATGATLTSRNQALRYAATGELYRWDGVLPKVVAPGSTPASSGGTGVGAWLLVTTSVDSPLSQASRKALVDLDFVNNVHKIYEQYGLVAKPLANILTMTRSTTGTYDSPLGIATAAINTARVAYNPFTGEPLGLLAEQQRTNLLLHSQYTGASGETPPSGWNMGATTGATTTAASGRFASAIRATQSGTSQREYYTQAVTLTAATTYTLSCFFAAGTSANDKILAVTTTDTPTGVTSLNGSAVLSAGVYSITFTTVTGGTYNVRIGLGCFANATGTVIHETPQLEAGPTATSYIPTTTAAASRTYDEITIPSIVTDLSKATEYTLFAEYTVLDSSAGVLFGVGDTFANTCYATVNTPFFTRSGGVVGPSSSAYPVTVGSRYKHAIKLKSGDYACYRNGVALFTSAAVHPVPANISRVKLASAPWEASSSASNQAIMVFHQFMIIPRALTAAELQVLTS